MDNLEWKNLRPLGKKKEEINKVSADYSLWSLKIFGLLNKIAYPWKFDIF